jgi:hypothetical protein
MPAEEDTGGPGGRQEIAVMVIGLTEREKRSLIALDDAR